jgi:hypothetical protein
MQRRSFLGAIPLILLSVKTFALGQKNEKNDGVVKLSSGEEFKLPARIEEGERIQFKVSGSQMQPPIIRRNGHLIMGESQDMALDRDFAFTLVYANKEKGWVLI